MTAAAWVLVTGCGACLLLALIMAAVVVRQARTALTLKHQVRELRDDKAHLLAMAREITRNHYEEFLIKEEEYA